MMLSQELFDAVVYNLRKQGSKALLDDEQLKKTFQSKGACAYRTKDGKCCAAGGMLTLEEYDPKMEGKSLRIVMDMAPSFAERVIGDAACVDGVHAKRGNYTILKDLQFIHDRLQVEDWEQGFRDLANRYELIYTPLATT